MKHDTLIYIVIGSAIVGVAYYLWKQEQAPPSSSGIGSTIAGYAGTALGADYAAGATVGGAISSYYQNVGTTLGTIAGNLGL